MLHTTGKQIQIEALLQMMDTSSGRMSWDTVREVRRKVDLEGRRKGPNRDPCESL